MIFLLSFFWYLRTARALLFALHLWQLKEYHIKRFLAHFETYKGKRLFWHPFVAAKLLLFLLWFFQAQAAAFLLLTLYIGEAALLFNALRTKTLLLPVLTRKTIVLTVSLILIQALFLAGALTIFLAYLVPLVLVFDLLSLLVGSLVVLVWQPYTVFERNRILKKAKAKRAKLNKLKAVGITGSYGKTSTKELLSHILLKKFVTVKTPEHKNSEMGIAHTILYDLTDEHEVFVAEMGAYSKGGIKLLADMVKPEIGIVTGVNEQHLGVFGSTMNLFSAEGGGELIESLPQGGVLILNDDSPQLHERGPWLQLWNPNFARYLWSSTKAQKDFFAKDVFVKKEQISFTMVDKDNKEARVVLPLIGGHNAENVLLAAAAAKELGMDIVEIAKALEDVPKEASALRLLEGKKDVEILDSSYSANPTGVLAALEHLKFWQGKKILVMPSLIELGSASRKLHIEIGRKIGEVCDFAVITTRDRFSSLLEGAKEKGMKEEDMLFLENPKEIAKIVLEKAGKDRPESEPRPEGAGNVVLLEGRVPSGILPLLQA